MKKANRNIFSYLFFLVCLFVISISFLPEINASFFSKTAEADQARVTEFSFDLSNPNNRFLESISKSWDPTADDYNAQIKITGTSETAVKVKCELTIYGNLPLKIQFPCDHTGGSIIQEIIDNVLEDETHRKEYIDGRVVIGFEKEIGPNDSSLSKTYDVTIGWADDADSYIYENGVADIELNMEIVQID